MPQRAVMRNLLESQELGGDFAQPPTHGLPRSGAMGRGQSASAQQLGHGARLREGSKRPSASAFNQQELNAWRPVLTARSVVGLFATIGVLFVPIGIVILHASDSVVEVTSGDYSGSCCVSNCGTPPTYGQVDRNPCNVSVTVTREMQPPIYAYYQLTNFFQNHRRYVYSRDDRQLSGLDADAADVEDACSEGGHMHHVYGGGAGGAASLINPCGLVAWSVFNDSFAMRRPNGGAPVPLDQTDIAWRTDREHKYANNRNGSTGQNFPPFAHERTRTCAELPTAALVAACVAADVPHAGWCFEGSGYCAEDQHFMVWMRAAGLPNFRKLFAVINEPLAVGTYTVSVSNGFDGPAGLTNAATGLPQPFLYPVSTFGGTKAFVLSTSSWIGGKNPFLGYAYVFAGVVFLVLALTFWLKYRAAPAEPGQPPYKAWPVGDRADRPAENPSARFPPRFPARSRPEADDAEDEHED